MLLILAALAQAAVTLAALDVRWVVALDAPPAATPGLRRHHRVRAAARRRARRCRSGSRPGALAARPRHDARALGRRRARVRGRRRRGRGLVAPIAALTRWRTTLPGALAHHHLGHRLAALFERGRRPRGVARQPTATWCGALSLGAALVGPPGARAWIACTSASMADDWSRSSWRPAVRSWDANTARPHHGDEGRGRPADRRHDRQCGLQPRPGIRPSALAVARGRRRRPARPRATSVTSISPRATTCCAPWMSANRQSAMDGGLPSRPVGGPQILAGAIVVPLVDHRRHLRLRRPASRRLRSRSRARWAARRISACDGRPTAPRLVAVARRRPDAGFRAGVTKSRPHGCSAARASRCRRKSVQKPYDLRASGTLDRAGAWPIGRHAPGHRPGSPGDAAAGTLRRRPG